MASKPAQFTIEQINSFLDEVNGILAPVLMIVSEPRDDLTRFRVRLRPTPYAMADQVTVTDLFQDVIRLLSNDILGVKPTFNMNATIFWYYVEADDE